MPFHIAIDGPVAAGKGTVSRLVAQRLGYLYIDTGAMYRTVAYFAQENNISLEDEPALIKAIKTFTLDMRDPGDDEKDGRLTTIILNDEDISWKIRTEEVSRAVSTVAALAGVREILVQKQQLIANNKDVVMEGRDITYRVLPKAQLKIYLGASDIVRAKRRHMQLLTKGDDVSFDEVYSDLLRRDLHDSTRSVDPLRVTDDAWVIDSSDLSIEQVVDLIVAKVMVMREIK